MSAKWKQRQEGLLELMKENPDLPVVPFVDADIIADDSGFWLGCWGIVRVHYYIVPLDSDTPLL